MNITREYFRPAENSGYEHYIPEGRELPPGTEIYINLVKGTAMYFSGRRSRPDWHYRYPSTERLYEAVHRYLDAQIKAEADKRERKENAKNWVHDVKVGDVFRCSWGYDQTNIDYFEVTALIGKKMCEVRELVQEIKHTGHDQGTCVPVPGQFVDETKAIRKKILNAGSRPALAIYSFAHAYRIEPEEVAPGVKVFKPDHWTSYA